MNRYISHENSANEIFDTLYTKLEPKWMRKLQISNLEEMCIL